MKQWLVLLALLGGGCSRAKNEPAPKETAKPVYYRVDPATAARVNGVVTYRGVKPPKKVISMDAEEACQQLHKTPVYEEDIAAGKDGGLANVFVYIKTGLEGKTFEPPKEAVILDQHGCTFVPRVVGLRAGQTLAVKNSDPVSHNIHPMPRNNREWNQQQSPQAPDLQRRFARMEVMIPVKCNVHAWMKSYIGVMDHPYFAVTDAAGAFELKGVPPGEYTIAVWQEKLGEQAEKVTLAPAGDQPLNFTFK